MQRSDADPRDARDLNVLAMRRKGFGVAEIAKHTGLSRETVETILAIDAEEFPHEPVRAA